MLKKSLYFRLLTHFKNCQLILLLMCPAKHPTGTLSATLSILPAEHSVQYARYCTILYLFLNTLNSNIQIQILQVVERLGHFDCIVPSLAWILTRQHGVGTGKIIPLGNPWKCHFRRLEIEKCPYMTRPSRCLLIIISLLLKNVLTALIM